ncbi:hypothetical protein ACTXPD_14950 [Vreelandella alkaliphila]|uniref:hypothetical protein n=1 Tax=Vreelandella alkaliphila TaxID=272774 RepID=UPI003FD81F3B
MPKAKEKTTIKGTPRQFNQEELDAKIEAAVTHYEQSPQSKHLIRHSLHKPLLEEFERLILEGYRLETQLPLMDLNFSPYVIALIKPEHLLTEDLEAVKKETKQRYVEELEAEHHHYQSLLLQQLLEAEEEKQRAKQEAEREKLIEKFKHLLNPIFPPLYP